jgi:hypothetical protein
MVLDDGGIRETTPYWLTRGMARALGVNLSSALAAGALGRDGLEELVLRCAACGRQAECMPWLGQNAAHAETLPDYCALKAPLEALRRRTQGRNARPPSTAF